jgi:hypothetical protein
MTQTKDTHESWYKYDTSGRLPTMTDFNFLPTLEMCGLLRWEQNKLINCMGHMPSSEADCYSATPDISHLL